MASSKKEVEEQLQQAGHSLLKLPSNSDDLLKLLDEVEVLLSAVGQAPSTSMQDALLPTMTALISDVLLQHSYMDVKVSVASCITEITRITAPDAPYDDDQMKVIFKLIGAAIENLSNLSGRCYKKAVSILKIVAKIRSTVMMLDLDCYTLIAEMFQQFLNIIQSDHPLAVFLDMETIMTTVLDEIHETEEIPLELLKILLSSVRMENQKISPFSWKLSESVLNNCAAKLRFYLLEAVKSMGTPLDDYALVVSSICQRGSNILKLDRVLKNQVTEAVRVNAACPTSVGKSVAAPTSNGPTVVHESSKSLQRFHLTKHSKEIDLHVGDQPGNSLSVKAVTSAIEPDSGIKRKGPMALFPMDPEEKSEIEPHSSLRKRGRKPNSLMNPEEGYKNYWTHSDKKSPKSAGNRKSHEKGADCFLSEDHLCVNTTVSSPLPSTLEEMTEPSSFPSAVQKSIESPDAQPKAEEDIASASLLQQNGHPDGTEARRGRPKKQVAAAHQEANPTSISPAKEGSSAQAGEKTPGPIDTSKLKSKESSPLKPKSRGRPRKYPAKVIDERVITSVHADTGKSSAVPCIPEKNQQESALNLETGNINPSPVQKVGTGPVSATRPWGRPRKLAPKSNQDTVLASPLVVVTAESPFPSGPKKKPEQEPASQAGTRGSIKDDAVGTDGADGSLSKILKSEIKIEGDTAEGTPKIIRKRKRSIGKEVANPMPDPDDRLVGKGIKVWWPQDKKFYNGVVRSYDSVRKKHLVIYTDGEKENLNLRKQRWQLIGEGSGDTHIQPRLTKDSPKTVDSDIIQKRKRKRKPESSMQASGGFSLKRISGTGTGASAGLSTVERMNSDGNSADRSTLNEHIEEDKSKFNDIDRMMNDDDEISAGELKVDMKTGMDSMQITPEVVTGSRKENPKVGIEPSVSGVAKEMTELKTHVDLETRPEAMILSKEENLKVDVKAFDTKGMTELSNGTNDASSPSSPVLDKAV